MIKLTKIEESSNANFMSGDWKNYVPGQDNPGVSIPIEYWIKGILVKEPVVGECLFVDRLERNGIECLGLFRSSPVVEVSAGEGNSKIIETKNSIYLLEPVDS